MLNGIIPHRAMREKSVTLTHLRTACRIEYEFEYTNDAKYLFLSQHRKIKVFFV